MAVQYRLTIDIDIHDAPLALATARKYAAACGYFEDDAAAEIATVCDAVPWLIESGVTPLDHGFEIVTKLSERLSAPYASVRG